MSLQVKYTFAGNRDLAKTFGFIQVGQELALAGYIAGYEFHDHMLEINVRLLTLA
jgi:hypothetical protein